MWCDTAGLRKHKEKREEKKVFLSMIALTLYDGEWS